MWKDPIVEEVRRTRAKMAADVDYDPKKLIEKLRENQNKSGWKVVSFAKKRVQKNKTK